MLETMIFKTISYSRLHTPAEASDVANAVLDGTDAVMLSGETSVGKYPVQAIQMMDRIIRKTEDQLVMQQPYNPNWISTTHEYDPLSKSACVLADNLKASTIVALTHSGSTAVHVAKFRPHACDHRRHDPREDHAAPESYLGNTRIDC